MTFSEITGRLRAAACATALLAASTVLTAPEARAEEPRYGGTLKIALLGLDTSDPHRHTGSIGVQQVYVEALTSIADDGSVIPFLAKDYAISEDGLTYTFTLQDRVTFHNGREMTADDVLQNFERVKAEVSKGWLASAMKQVEGFEAPDDRTFVVHMKEPYAPFLNLISELWILAPESPGWAETITRPIGTGPFEFGEWVPQVELVAPKHEAYWQDGLPYLDAVRFDLRDSQDNDLALRSGDLHVARVAADKVPTLVAAPDVDVQHLKDTTWYFWSFNNRNPEPPFDNVRVREALTHALDKAAYMNFIAGDSGIVTNQMVIPGNFHFDQVTHDADKHAEPDLEKARQILAEEGVDPAATTIDVVSWQSSYSEVAVQMMKKLGFQVQHSALDDLGAQKRLGDYDWDVAPMASGPRADVFLRYVRMMSDGPNPVLWGGVQDETYDAIVTDAVTSVDPEKRKAKYLEAWKRVMDNYWTVVVGHAANPIGVRSEVRNFTTGFTWSPHRVDGGVAHAWLARSGS